MSIHPTAFLHANQVQLTNPVTLEAFVLLGEGHHPRPLIMGPHALIRSHTVIYAGTQIGSHFQTGHHVLIRADNHIGDHVSIGSGTVLEHHIHMASHVRLHSQVFVPEFTVLEEGCWLGPHVVLTNAKYPQSPGVKDHLKGVHIKPHAKIGAGSTLLPGITIGAHALVGAGSVVTKDVPDYAVMVGNPAQQIKDIRELPYSLE